MSDSIKRFTGLADIYSKARPSYPDQAIEHIITTAHVTPDSLIVDVGCGTGISTRLFAQRGLQVIGLEPNDDMRGKAQAAATVGGAQPRYTNGSAEQTGLADNSVDLVLAAQAFHWFEPQRALTEFHRILKTGGWVALMWNERDERDSLTRGYGDALRLSPETAKVEGHRGAAGEPILSFPLLVEARRDTFCNSQVVDEDGLIARAFSASYAPKDEPGKSRLRTRLQEIFREHSRDGQAQIIYETSVYMARKP